jgi:hypothetical protein
MFKVKTLKGNTIKYEDFYDFAINGIEDAEIGIYKKKPDREEAQAALKGKNGSVHFYKIDDYTELTFEVKNNMLLKGLREKLLRAKKSTLKSFKIRIFQQLRENIITVKCNTEEFLREKPMNVILNEFLLA